MSRVIDAICWDGVYASLCMYVVLPVDKDFDIGCGKYFPEWLCPVKPVKPFLLEGCDFVDGYQVILFEMQLAEVPDNLEQVLVWCLENAARDGAPCAWFGFEGSFDYEHFLTGDVSDQIYAICGMDSVPKCALEDALIFSEEWRDFVMKVRSEVVVRNK